MQPAEYEWDAFLSYRRWQEWPEWVRAHFHPLFLHYLGEELGREPRVFVDWGDETPGDWPTHLARALARSRVLVPLLSRLYFRSPWCATEYELMKRREDVCAGTLIVPAVIHDGDELPPHARRTYSAILTAYSNPRIATRGRTAARLADEINKWMPTVRQAIEDAPEYDPTWLNAHVDAMDQTFEQSTQTHVPSWGA